MTIQVCKPVYVEEQRSIRTKYDGEYRWNFAGEVQVCGEGPTFQAAKEELALMLTGRCRNTKKCVVQRPQSATDLGPSFWENLVSFLGTASRGCSAGLEYGGRE